MPSEKRPPPETYDIQARVTIQRVPADRAERFVATVRTAIGGPYLEVGLRLHEFGDTQVRLSLEGVQSLIDMLNRHVGDLRQAQAQRPRRE